MIWIGKLKFEWSFKVVGVLKCGLYCLRIVFRLYGADNDHEGGGCMVVIFRRKCGKVGIIRSCLDLRYRLERDKWWKIGRRVEVDVRCMSEKKRLVNDALMNGKTEEFKWEK